MTNPTNPNSEKDYDLRQPFQNTPMNSGGNLPDSRRYPHLHPQLQTSQRRHINRTQSRHRPNTRHNPYSETRVHHIKDNQHNDRPRSSYRHPMAARHTIRQSTQETTNLRRLHIHSLDLRLSSAARQHSNIPANNNNYQHNHHYPQAQETILFYRNPSRLRRQHNQ